MKLDFTRHGTDSATPGTAFFCCLVGIVLVTSVLYAIFTSETSEYQRLLEVLAFGVFCLVIGFGLARWNWNRNNG